MAKYKRGFFLMLSRGIFSEQYAGLSTGAKWLYVVLNELEHRFTASNAQSTFYRSDKDLAADAGISLPTLKRYKAELRKTDLVKMAPRHFIDPASGTKSEERITAYQIKK